jgi:hypothetical protein
LHKCVRDLFRAKHDSCNIGLSNFLFCRLTSRWVSNFDLIWHISISS